MYIQIQEKQQTEKLLVKDMISEQQTDKQQLVKYIISKQIKFI